MRCWFLEIPRLLQSSYGLCYDSHELVLWKTSAKNSIHDWQEGLLVTLINNVFCHSLYNEMSIMTKVGNTWPKLKKSARAFFLATQGDYFSNIIMDWIENDVRIIVVVIVLKQLWSCFLGEHVVIVECDGQKE